MCRQCADHQYQPGTYQRDEQNEIFSLDVTRYERGPIQKRKDDEGQQSYAHLPASEQQLDDLGDQGKEFIPNP